MSQISFIAYAKVDGNFAFHTVFCNWIFIVDMRTLKRLLVDFIFALNVINEQRHYLLGMYSVLKHPPSME